MTSVLFQDGNNYVIVMSKYCDFYLGIDSSGVLAKVINHAYNKGMDW